LDQVVELVAQLEKQMKEAAKALEFERAAQLRDEIAELKRFIPSHALGGAAAGEKRTYKKVRRAR
jgi:excinuclease ABC subunit B